MPDHHAICRNPSQRRGLNRHGGQHGRMDRFDAGRRLCGAWAMTERDLRARDHASRDDPALPYHQRWVWRRRDGSQVALCLVGTAARLCSKYDWRGQVRFLAGCGGEHRHPRNNTALLSVQLHDRYTAKQHAKGADAGRSAPQASAHWRADDRRRWDEHSACSCAGQAGLCGECQRISSLWRLSRAQPASLHCTSCGKGRNRRGTGLGTLGWLGSQTFGRPVTTGADHALARRRSIAYDL